MSKVSSISSEEGKKFEIWEKSAVKNLPKMDYKIRLWQNYEQEDGALVKIATLKRQNVSEDH